MSAPDLSGNVRTMSVDDWATFIRRTSAALQQPDLEEVARDAKQKVYSSKALSGKEKDAIWRTIDRAVQVCMGDAEVVLDEGPDGPRISVATPKGEGRYEG